MTSRWSLYVRNDQYKRGAQIDDFQRLETVQKFCDVGTWILDLDGRLPAAEQLRRPNYGIVLYKGSTPVFSGDVNEIDGKYTMDRRRITFSGYDDNVWLRSRVAHPEPATSSWPYVTNESDVRAGAASTIIRAYVNANLGPGAIVARRHPALTMGVDPLVGITLTGRVRWTQLLKDLQEIAVAGGGLGFRIVQVGSGLQFQVYMPVDRSGTVKFSFELGNLTEAAYKTTAPTANWVYCGGGGEGTARIVAEGGDPQSIIDYRRREIFVDRRDSSVGDELNRTVVENLAENAAQTGFSLSPVDVQGQEYITHYGLGDKVAGVLDGVRIADVVRELKVTFDPNGPTKVNPLIGTTGAVNPATETKTFKSIKALVRKVSNLEGRR